MKTKEEIKKLLEQDHRLRDSDNKLLARFFSNELARKNIDVKKITAYDFLVLLATNKLHSIEGITRMRRKVQEENKHLRGVAYIKRQSVLQDKMKEKLGYNINLSSELPKNTKPYVIGKYDTY